MYNYYIIEHDHQNYMLRLFKNINDVFIDLETDKIF